MVAPVAWLEVQSVSKTKGIQEINFAECGCDTYVS